MKHIKKIAATILLTSLIHTPNIALAQSTPEVKKEETHWYDTLKLKGYTQFRYNRLPSFKENDKLVNKQGDKTLGAGNGFSIRRARLTVYGDLNPYMSLYFQTDFASAIDSQLNVAIVRDLYTDLSFNKSKELKLRVGQSKVPFGFDNMQSSQNRLAFDRSDAINSALKDERDIGLFAYWTPKEIKDRFKHLVESGLKGSGDYGVIGLGVYNGQGANKLALSDDMHVVGHLAYPFKLKEQFVELGGGAYIGKYYSKTDGTSPFNMNKGKMKDERVNAYLVVYPQPFGFQAEGTYGTGASQGATSSTQHDIKARSLKGGYSQIMYKIDDVLGTTSLIPYTRASYYNGGRKFEDNTPHYKVKELELGLEWQVFKNLEVTAAYDMASRTSNGVEQKGHITRMQVQVNY